MAENQFLTGVIEGFYGPPWSAQERAELFGWMSDFGLDTYFYAPKDDLKHRAIWRETYSAEELAALREVSGGCATRGLRFIYGLGPGLDIRYSDPADREALKARFAQLTTPGGPDFALLFDDIPDRMAGPDAARFGTFAAAQASVVNELFGWLAARQPAARLFFCPTPYCGRMAEAGLGGPGYLGEIGRLLNPAIEIFWTGPEIVSETITVPHLRGVREQLRRKPVIWDNLHANDYDGRRFFCGPYSGRDPALRGETGGVLANPNNELPLNYVPLRTLGRFAAAERWDGRAEFLGALRGWLPAFDTVRGPAAFDDLREFADCFYLPHRDGPEAARLIESFRTDRAEFKRRAARLKAFCVRITELRHRPLFYALSRRVWDLREELDLLERALDHAPGAAFRSDSHLPGLWRGGFIAKLQNLLAQRADGSFTSAP